MLPYNKLQKNEFIPPLIITTVFLIISYLLHNSCESTMFQSEETWQVRLNAHLNNYPFSIRHFTSQTIIFLNSSMGISIRESFFILNFILAFLLGPVFYVYLRKLNFSRLSSNIGIAMLFIAYPIMSAHFEPVFTWDDFWSNLFTVISFSFVLSRKFIHAGIFFALGCLAREQTVILFPAYAFTIFLFSQNQNMIKRILYVSFPVIIWGSYYSGVVRQGDPNRLKYIALNFEDFQWGRDSVFSMFISFGFMWTASFIAWFRLIDKKLNRIAMYLFWGFLLTLPVNTVFTIAMTFARETRIFFPPFIFVIPLSLIVLKALALYWNDSNTKTRKLCLSVLLIMIIYSSYIIIRSIVFPEFRYRQCWSYSQIWAGVNLGISIVISFLYIISRKFQKIYASIEKYYLNI